MADDGDAGNDAGGIDLIESAFGLISAIDVVNLVGHELAVAVLGTEELRNVVNALSAALLERFEKDGGWALDGAMSAAAWTAQRTGSARAGLRSRRRQGAALARLPALEAQARTGRLSAEHLRVLGDCVHRRPDLATEHEAVWLEQADALDAEHFTMAARHWLAAASDAADASPAPSDRVSHLHMSRCFQGWLRVDGHFAPADADVVEAALGAGVDRALRAAHDGDPSVACRPPSALRAGALVDLAAQVMRQEPSDASAPDRYRVAVLVQAGQPTDPAEAACDAAAYRVALGAAGEILDVGRQTSRWPLAIRRAITLRDGGCTFPGCDQPPSWTDIHHCTPWHEGGPTSVDNGALLCRVHHSFIHHHRWRITIDNGKPTTRRPDSTPFTIQRWQASPRGAAES